jgi:hypothetical protein
LREREKQTLANTPAAAGSPSAKSHFERKREANTSKHSSSSRFPLCIHARSLPPAAPWIPSSPALVARRRPAHRRCMSPATSKRHGSPLKSLVSATNTVTATFDRSVRSCRPLKIFAVLGSPRAAVELFAAVGPCYSAPRRGALPCRRPDLHLRGHRLSLARRRETEGGAHTRICRRCRRWRRAGVDPARARSTAAGARWSTSATGSIVAAARSPKAATGSTPAAVVRGWRWSRRGSPPRWGGRASLEKMREAAGGWVEP